LGRLSAKVFGFYISPAFYPNIPYSRWETGGSANSKLDLTQEKGKQLKTFERHLERFLNFRKDPMEFVKELLAEGGDDVLYANIARQLKREKEI